MKKLFVLTTVLLFVLVLSVIAGKKNETEKPKAEKTKATTYTDAKYKFSFNIPAGWTTATPKSDIPLRLSMTKTDYPKTIGRAYKNIAQVLGSEDYIIPPLVHVWVVPTDEGYEQFLSDLTNSSYDSEIKNEIINAFRPDWDDIEIKSFFTVSHNQLNSDGHKGTLWYGSIRYLAFINDQDEHVYYGCGLAVYQNDAHSVLLVTIRSEENIITNILTELQPSLNNIKW